MRCPLSRECVSSRSKHKGERTPIKIHPIKFTKISTELNEEDEKAYNVVILGPTGNLMGVLKFSPAASKINKIFGQNSAF